MSLWIPIFALAIFPAAYLIAINPVGFSWSLHHGSEPMPPELRQTVQRTDRYVLAIRDIIIVALLALLILYQTLPAEQVGLSLNSWALNVVIGGFAGLMRVGLQRILWKLLPSLSKNPNNPELLSGSVWFWIASTFIGALAEELWIAVCIVILMQSSHSVPLAVSLTVIVFGLLHLNYRLGGALAIASYGAISGCLFLSRGSLIPSYLFHCMGNLAVLYWVRRRANGSSGNWGTKLGDGTP